jgi:hypothetical protein
MWRDDASGTSAREMHLLPQNACGFDAAIPAKHSDLSHP